MRIWSGLRLPRQLGLAAFLLVVAVAVAVAVLAVRTERLGRAADDLRDQPFAIAEALFEAQDKVFHAHIALEQAVQASDGETAMLLLDASERAEASLREWLGVIAERTPERIAELTPVLSLLADRAELREEVKWLLGSGRRAEALALFGQRGPLVNDGLHAVMKSLLDAERLRAAALQQEARTVQADTRNALTSLAVAAGAALAAVALVLAVSLGTWRPLGRLSAALVSVAEGHGPVTVPYSGRAGPVGAVARAVLRFQESQAERDQALTALRRSEWRLRGALKDAERANAAKAQFLAAASHDLRQPLQALRLFVDVLDLRLSRPADREVLAQASVALDGAEQLLANYLDVSALDSGIVRAETSSFPIDALLGELATECRPAATAKGLELVHVASSAVVACDRPLLRRVLRNLMVNAVSYTERGRVLVGCRRDGGTLRIQVWDTGIGIAPDQLDAVFEDFYQVGNAERDRTKGLGLGLSVVTRAARLMDLPIGVSSQPGRGSVFWVRVPLAARPSVRQVA